MKWTPLSVYATFQQVTDGRHKCGVRYSVALMLTLILLGKLARMTTLQAIAEWVRYRGGWLRQVLPEQPKNLPCAATYSNVLRAVEADSVGAVARCGEEPSHERREHERERHVHVALDGKTLRGTLSHEAADQGKMHQLALYEVQTGELITGEKQNELSIVSQFLIPLLVQGRLISADALHTQRAFCFAVTRWQGDYLLIAKDNQATLADDLTLFFAELLAASTKAMGVWRFAKSLSVVNSMSFLQDSGLERPKPFDSHARFARRARRVARSSMALPVCVPMMPVRVGCWTSCEHIGALKIASTGGAM